MRFATIVKTVNAIIAIKESKKLLFVRKIKVRWNQSKIYGFKKVIKISLNCLRRPNKSPKALQINIFFQRVVLIKERDNKILFY